MDLRAIRRAAVGQLPVLPLTGAADARWSIVSSADDSYTEPNDVLVDLLIDAASVARSLSLADLEGRCQPSEAAWVRRWPGEHYRLLAALARVLKPRVAIEVGTFLGQGALAMAEGDCCTKVITYDIVPWRDFPDTALREDDFTEGRLEQPVGDLGDPDFLASQVETLRSADLIFVDGPKDGHWEQAAVRPILDCLTDRQRLVVFDDIRLLEMVQLWRDLPFPKLDATSLGHWSGTGMLHTAVSLPCTTTSDQQRG